MQLENISAVSSGTRFALLQAWISPPDADSLDDQVSRADG
jgi:hypothetical protein